MPFPIGLLLLDVSPESTVRTFVAAVNAQRPDAARQVVGGKSAVFPAGARIPQIKATIGRANVSGDQATVDVDVAFRGGKGHETVDLRRAGGDWRIVPVDPRGAGKGPRTIGFLAYFALHPEIALVAKTADKKTACLSNVKQLALATLMYCGDHDDVLPKNAAGWKAAIMPYTKNERIFHCPEDSSGKESYFFEPRVAGVSMTSVANPAETAMIVEGARGRATFRHDGYAAVSYVDGHAKLVRAPLMVKARTTKLK